MLLNMLGNYPDIVPNIGGRLKDHLIDLLKDEFFTVADLFNDPGGIDQSVAISLNSNVRFTKAILL